MKATARAGDAPAVFRGRDQSGDGDKGPFHGLGLMFFPFNWLICWLGDFHLA